MAGIWDIRANLYDVCEASDYRRGSQKAALFGDMRGRVLFAAVGTGVDIKYFPPDLSIAAIDISEKMLQKAERRARNYRGHLELCLADAQDLKFPSASFDTVVTSCTMCSVPDPVRAFREFYRVLRPRGRLLMFEHVRSRNPLLALTLDLMTLLTRLTGTEMNRNTVENAIGAGFRITQIESAYLDIVLAIRATKDAVSPDSLEPSAPVDNAVARQTRDGELHPFASGVGSHG